MKKIAVTLLSAGFLSSIAGINFAYGQVIDSPAKTQAAKVANKRTAKKVPAMRNRVYSQLARAQKLADEGVKIAGFEVLDEVKERIDSLNSYERAMLWNFYAFMYYGNDDISSAIEHFELVIKEQAIPDSLYLSTLYSLAQLSMQQQDYPQALTYLQQWQANNSKALTASQHIMFAQIYYQDKQFEKVIKAVKQAISLAEQSNATVKENWLILQRASYYELKQPLQVVKVIEQLVRLYDKPEYWLQLAGMYGELGQEDKQLAVMEAAWQAGHISKESDVMTLAQLYRFHQVPYKAAVLLEQAIANGTVVASEKSLAALAQAYVAAKEDEKALPILTQAAEIADTGKFDMQLAQAYLNLERWQEAITSANKALLRGGISREGDMYLVIGMAKFNLQAFDDALIAFTQAQKIPQSAKTAKQWFHYVEREQGQHERLAMLN
ncbi:tetratricopeptide repeat protein [Cognaticolwellia aestuarii]|uniref:tetratricopeptide repeat protein n=1 Tax=Cognaticolwellia aestuarii TaxID=329993 RepID=UPI0011782633|nr:tetratricopeptide repeat protein [Cognaticolwellia aestuarii]